MHIRMHVLIQMTTALTRGKILTNQLAAKVAIIQIYMPTHIIYIHIHIHIHIHMTTELTCGETYSTELSRKINSFAAAAAFVVAACAVCNTCMYLIVFVCVFVFAYMYIFHIRLHIYIHIY